MSAYLGGKEMVAAGSTGEAPAPVPAPPAKAVTMPSLLAMRAAGTKISMLTCYDASFAALMDRCGVDVLLIGDSLGMVCAGYDSTLLVPEAIPAALGKDVTERLHIPTIGIGAGPDCSGQVLVMHDLLGVFPGRKARFVRNFMDGQTSIDAAIQAYVAAVKDGSFPGPEHCF